MPLLSYEQDITGEEPSYPYPNFLPDWISYAIPYCSSVPRDDTLLMRKVLTSLSRAVATYRYNEKYRKVVRALDLLENWNYLVKTEYNIAVSLLGYTENQLPFINEAATYLLSIGIQHYPMPVVKVK
jgi:hypothetical protein